MPRGTDRGGFLRSSRSGIVSTTLRIIVPIATANSYIANLAPRQRRYPPPNGTYSNGVGLRARKRSGRNWYGSGNNSGLKCTAGTAIPTMSPAERCTPGEYLVIDWAEAASSLPRSRRRPHWTCRTCDATVYGPPLAKHCTALDGPARCVCGIATSRVASPSSTRRRAT